jgi:putative membrane protein
MSDKDTGEKAEKRILILCVDRDGDLTTKGGVKTPVTGRSANLEAAVSLALSDPEEPDANAMFEAVKLFDRLIKEKAPEEIFEIATICGTELGGVGADRKIVAELSSLLESFDADEVILVTDGYTDEAVLPLIESRVPVSSVRRIVVKHSESIEETAALFSRYLKILVQNPKYSRIALGLPGILLLVWSLLAIAGVEQFFYAVALVLVFGSILLIKGFGVDNLVKDFYKWAKDYEPPPLPVQISNYAAIAGLLCVAISIYSGYANTVGRVEIVDVGGWIGALPELSGYYIRGAIDLVVVGLATILFGRAIRMYFAHDPRVLRNAAFIVSIVWSRMIFDGAAHVLISPTDTTAFENLILAIIVGILIAIASVLVMLIIHRQSKEFFARSESKVEEFEDQD